MEHITEHPFYERFKRDIVHLLPDVLGSTSAILGAMTSDEVMGVALFAAASKAGLLPQFMQFTAELQKIDSDSRGLEMFDQYHEVIYQRLIPHLIRQFKDLRSDAVGLTDLKAQLLEEHLKTCKNPDCEVKKYMDELDKELSIV